MADSSIARQSKFRSKEKKVAGSAQGAKAYWKHRRQSGRRRVIGGAIEGGKKGFKAGAGVSMAAAGVGLSAGMFGETPKAWATRQAQQAGGDWLRKNSWRVPKDLKTWHIAAAPTVVGTVGGAAAGAISGWRKGKNPWHTSREHTNAVRSAHAKITRAKQEQGMAAKDYNTRIPKRVREGLIEAILETIT